jgi:hypothetical protein
MPGMRDVLGTGICSLSIPGRERERHLPGVVEEKAR